MRAALKALLLAITLGLAALTFLALFDSNMWWIRMTDFPRLQYAIALMLVLGALAVARPVSPKLRVALAALVLVALVYNAIKIGPYFLGMPHATISCADDRRFTVMVVNVQLKNHSPAKLLEIVGNRDPDMLLALETNEWWDRQLAVLSEAMPYSVAEITGSYFGMHLFSSLPLEETRIVYPINPDTPAILATVRLRSGEAAGFIGLHPRPPHPGQSSTNRDAELMWAALRALEDGSTTVVAGDFNAVPWERTIERFQRIGKLLDPREVEGFLPTYNAHSWWMSWPIDHFMHQDGLSVLSMEVLPGFGSDHFPVEITLCARPTGRKAPPLLPDDLGEAEATLNAAAAATGGDR